MNHKLGFAFLLSVLSALMHPAPALADARYISGEGNVPLAVITTGPKDGPEILFMHGIGLGAESFSPQFQSKLSEKYRMVAFDLRGHGMSGKPWGQDAYTDPAVWAEDVRRVIQATGLKKPIVVAWSYGTLVAADYIRTFGSSGVSGLILVGALGHLVQNQAPTAKPDPEVAAGIESFRKNRQSAAFTDQESAAKWFSSMIVRGKALPGWVENAQTLMMMSPPYAQDGLSVKFSRDNSDLLPLLHDLPVLVLHGEYDNAVPQASLEILLKKLPVAKAFEFSGAGHAPFAEQPRKFNRKLVTFVNATWQRGN